MYHELAMDRVSMTYSWHNINTEYGNNDRAEKPQRMRAENGDREKFKMADDKWDFAT